jgi:lipopolysaccharide/colanic/teichoic acid biosynthesis glycosyltransferase
MVVRPKTSTQPAELSPERPGAIVLTRRLLAGPAVMLLEPDSAAIRGPALAATAKAAVDFVLAAALLVVFGPVILAAAAIVRLTSSGPAFYRQARMGLGGRTFDIIKLRTMTHNCERESGPRWATPDDPRITPVGAFLRRTHIDELPQLLNVLRGEMSLVGPRPERPEFLPKLLAEVPGYEERLTVRPGVTGLAQVRLPPDTSVADVHRKLSYDLFYISRRSLWLDLRLMACTSVKLFGVPCGTAAGLLGIPGPAIIEGRAPAAPAPDLQPT